MSTIDVIENKITYLVKHLTQASQFSDVSVADLQKDVILRGAVERELYVIAQATIDLAEAVVAYKHLRKPTTMREAFDVLAENRILTTDFVERFVGIVGFRNALAHDYEDLRLEVLVNVLQQKLSEVKEFIVFLQERLGI